MTGFATLRPTSGHSYFWPRPHENQLVLYFLQLTSGCVVAIRLPLHLPS